MSSSTTISLARHFSAFYNSRSSYIFWIWIQSSWFCSQNRSVQSRKENRLLLNIRVSHFLNCDSSVSRKSWLDTSRLVDLQTCWLTFRPKIFLRAVTATTSTTLIRPSKLNKLRVKKIHISVRSPLEETKSRWTTTLPLPKVHQAIPKILNNRQLYRWHKTPAMTSHKSMAMVTLVNQTTFNRCSKKKVPRRSHARN